MPKTRTSKKPLPMTPALPAGGSSVGAETRPGLDLGRQIREQRYNALRSLTPAKLGHALDSFDAGYLREAVLIWGDMEDRIDIIKSCAGKRRKDVSRRPWEIVQLEESDEAASHKAALEDFFNHLTVTDATDLNQSGGMALLMRQMMGAQLQQYAVHEIIWSAGHRSTVNGQGMGLRAECKFVPLWLFENRRGRLAYTGVNGYSEGVLCQPGEWMITCGDALMKAVSACAILRSLSLKDWIGYSEKFGMPAVHGEISAAKGSQEWNDFMDALGNFANEFVIGTTTGAKINLIEVGKTGDAPFKPMVDYCDRMIATLFRGADLGTISAQGGGDSTGASLQHDESNLLQNDDCELISEVLQSQLGRRVIELVFGPGIEPLAYVQIQSDKPRDLRIDMDVDKHLLSLGIPMSQADALERYDRTAPDEGEALVKEPAPRPAFGAPAAEQQQPPPEKKEEEQDEDPKADPASEALPNAIDPAEHEKFMGSAQKLVAESRIADHAALIAELSEILTIEDPIEQDRRIAEFLAALPESIGEDAKQVEAWEALLGSSLVNGFAEPSHEPAA